MLFGRGGRQRFRALTAGETAMAARLFGHAIDDAAVRVYDRRYLPFGLQPKNCAMTPNGAICFHKSCCLLDLRPAASTRATWQSCKPTAPTDYEHKN